MEDSKTYVFGQDNSLLSLLVPLLSNRGIDPSVLAMLNNGNFGGAGGSWFIWIIFLLMFLTRGGGIGLGGGTDTGFVANQLNNDTGRDLLLQAINGNGSAISQLATNLNSDINTINATLSGLSSALQSVGSSVGMSGLQTINAIQSGNASLSAQLAQCCCDNRLLTTEQGYAAQIRTLEQTNQLGGQADRNTNTITSAIADLRTQMTREFCDVKERELQDKIDMLTATNTTLRGQIDNASQTAAITSYINGMVAPLQAQVNTIASKMPNTVPVEWPNLVAVNTTPGNNFYSGFNGFGYGNGFGWGWNGGSYWG